MNFKKLVAGAVAVALTLFVFLKITAPAVKNLNNMGGNIVAFGDSLTAGHGAAKGEDYPSVMAQKTSIPVVNLGVSGETAVQGLSRINDVFDHDPYIVLIEFGGNDFMQHVPFEQTVAAVGKMVDEVQARGAVAAVVDTGGPFMGQYTKAYKKIARDKGAVFVPAIFISKPELKSDAVHPNAAGYAVVADRVYKGIEKYLKN